MNKEEIKRELIELIKIKSYNGYEKNILNYLEDKLDGIGIDYEKIYIEKDRYNILINRGEEFFICTHVDTVPLDYGIRIENDTVYAIGSCDAKASIVSILKFLETTDELNSTIIFTVDEEGKGLGSEVIAKRYRFKRGIILEPTDMKIATASAGSLEYEILIKGKEAHGSCIEEGENAIEKAFEIINLIRNLKFLNENHPLIGKANYLLEHINGGSYELIVPEICKIVIDFRILPNQDMNKIRKELENFFKKLNLEYKLIDISYPFENKDYKFLNALKNMYKKALGREPEIIGYKSWTDASNFFKYSKSSVVIFGPGSLKYAHTKYENVNIKDIIDTIKFLKILNKEIFYIN